ncbi:hypothetical protein C4565_08385 [Candidatus Parcubacteria bacterium]|nr:MAG: hypothetical protein C4565_08385 [Candidatus Parcubacteria bacterium]
MFHVGKLYRCPEFCLLVYPTAKKARIADNAIGAIPGALVGNSLETLPIQYQYSNMLTKISYWSEKFRCQLRHTNPDDVFLFLGKSFVPKTGQVFLKFLFGNFEGWVIQKDYVKFERINL